RQAAHDAEVADEGVSDPPRRTMPGRRTGAQFLLPYIESQKELRPLSAHGTIGGLRRCAMTEAEWLACAEPETMTGVNPERMLAALRGKVSQRKVRLFATACCRRIIWHLLPEGCRQGVEVLERFADEDASTEELQACAADAQALAEGAGSESVTAAASV